MQEAFDPYFAWLGIPASQQPASHYTLLGLPRFETNPQAIEQAYAQRLAQLSGLMQGPHAQQASQLVAELTLAKNCLLDPDQRRDYNIRLTQYYPTPTQPAEPTPTPATPPHATPPPSAPEPVAAAPPATPAAPGSDQAPPLAGPADTGAAKAPAPRPRKKHAGLETLKIIGGGVAGLLIALLILKFVLPDRFPIAAAPAPQEEPTAPHVEHPLRPHDASPSTPHTPPREAGELATTEQTSPAPTTPADNTPPEPADAPLERLVATPARRPSGSPPTTTPPATPATQFPEPQFADPPPRVLLPIPTQPALAAAASELEEQIATATAAELLAAGTAATQPAERYVLLRAAADKAINPETTQSESEVAFDALDALAEEFEIDRLAEEINLLDDLSTLTHERDASLALALHGLRLTLQAQDAGRFDLAQQCSQVTLRCARSSGSRTLTREATLHLVDLLERAAESPLSAAPPFEDPAPASR